MTFTVRPATGDDADLTAYAAVVNAADPSNPTSLDELRWSDATYPGGRRFLAETGGRVVGAATTGRIYVYPPDHPDAWLGVAVLRDERRRGIGTALWAAASAHARSGGKVGFQLDVDATSTDGIAFLEHRGFTEIERSRVVRLDLAGRPAPDVEPPPGIELTTLAERPDLLAGVHAVAVAAFRDIPHGGTPMAAGDLGEFVARDVDRPGIPRDGFFVAFDARDGAVVGYASLYLVPGDPTIAWHDMTAVLPAARGRGVARALKLATVRWATARGLAALETGNDPANAPMRAVNARLGYRPLPDRITYRGPLHP